MLAAIAASQVRIKARGIEQVRALPSQPHPSYGKVLSKLWRGNHLVRSAYEMPYDRIKLPVNMGRNTRVSFDANVVTAGRYGIQVAEFGYSHTTIEGGEPVRHYQMVELVHSCRMGRCLCFCHESESGVWCGPCRERGSDDCLEPAWDTFYDGPVMIWAHPSFVDQHAPGSTIVSLMSPKGAETEFRLMHVEQRVEERDYAPHVVRVYRYAYHSGPKWWSTAYTIIGPDSWSGSLER